jgi:hypothetical protein
MLVPRIPPVTAARYRAGADPNIPLFRLRRHLLSAAQYRTSMHGRFRCGARSRASRARERRRRLRPGAILLRFAPATTGVTKPRQETAHAATARRTPEARVPSGPVPRSAKGHRRRGVHDPHAKERRLTRFAAPTGPTVAFLRAGPARPAACSAPSAGHQLRRGTPSNLDMHSTVPQSGKAVHALPC